MTELHKYFSVALEGLNLAGKALGYAVCSIILHGSYEVKSVLTVHDVGQLLV